MKTKPKKLPLVHLEYGTYPLCFQKGKIILMTEEDTVNNKVRICKKCERIWGNLEIA